MRRSGWRRGEDGHTLVELLVAMPLALLVASAALTGVLIGERSYKTSRERADALSQQHVFLERMTRELRQATTLTFLSSQLVEFDTTVRTAGGPGTLRKVRYDCRSGQACVRSEGPVGGTTGGSVTLVTGLNNADVFRPEPDFLNPTYIGVMLKVKFAADKQTITLRDGVDMRNLSGRR